MNTRLGLSPSRFSFAGRFSFAAPLFLAAAALTAGPALSACDGSAPGVVLASDTEDMVFTLEQESATTSFRLVIGENSTPGLTAATLGFAVDIVSGGPAVEVSVTPPGGTASTDSTSESVTSSGVTYDRYIVTLGDQATLCPASGACSLDYNVVVTRTSALGMGFTAITTISGVITGDVLTSDDVSLDFL